MENKLTLEHLAPYLAYELKFVFDNRAYWADSGLTYTGERYDLGELIRLTTSTENVIGIKWNDEKNGLSMLAGLDSAYHKPILRPLSDLTKEIEHNGERFVPMVRLLEYKERNHFSKDPMLKSCSINQDVKVVSGESKNYSSINLGTNHIVKYLIETTNMGTLVYSFTYCEHFDRFSMRDETRDITLGVGHQLQLFQKLYEYQFDVFGLIAAGLAVDINTIDNEQNIR